MDLTIEEIHFGGKTQYNVAWTGKNAVSKAKPLYNLVKIAFEEMKLDQVGVEVNKDPKDRMFTFIGASTYFLNSFDSMQYQMHYGVSAVLFETKEQAEQFIDIIEKRLLMKILKDQHA